MFNPFSLEGKRILVTGASSGIGRSVALTCSKMGAKLVLSARNEERLQETSMMLDGDGHIGIIADLLKQECIDDLVAKSPTLNGLVYCAGVPALRGVKHIDRALLEEINAINEIAPMLLISALLKKKKLQKQSSIVLVASMSGVFVGNIGESPYSATKGALSGFAKSAALELASQGTRVNTICPGVVETKLLDLSNELFSEKQLKDTMLTRYPMKRFGRPEDVANGVVFLLSDASSWITGINLLIDGGYCLS